MGGERAQAAEAAGSAVDAERVHAEPVDAQPVDTEPVDTEPVDTEPANAQPVGPAPAGALVEPAGPVAAGVAASARAEATPARVDSLEPPRAQVLGGAPAPRRPKIGDTRPGPVPLSPPIRGSEPRTERRSDDGGDRLRRGRAGGQRADPKGDGGGESDAERRRSRRRGTRPKGGAETPIVDEDSTDEPVGRDAGPLERRKGRERKGRPVGRYLMVVHVAPEATQIAVLEGRNLLDHYVSRPTDDANEIDGNIYVGRVKNVLPGMEAAFVDIGTPKNAVLYRGDIRYDGDDIEKAPAADGTAKKGGKKGDDGPKPTRGHLTGAARNARIEQLLSPGQTIVCQVTKNPIGAKGARLTQEVSLPGRFVVLVPNSDTYGISKRLADDERKRLRRILEGIRPESHGLIVRTAAEGATADELTRDVARLLGQWNQIEALARTARGPGLVYKEPDLAVRVIREEFNRNYRGVIIDDEVLFNEVKGYVAGISPELADRVELAWESDDPLPVFERHHIHEQIHKALDRKVWLPSGGSLIIERTEALTVIDVNTGKNVGRSNLEETVYRNNLEAAEEIAHQLRLRDIGGIIVIDFIDMEITANRADVIRTFRAALARDKTRTQVFDISELGLVEMTRKRISEGLVESFSDTCPTCGGRGIIINKSLF